LKNPAAMGAKTLSGRVGPGLDPCGAIRVSIELMDGQMKETVFRLGVGMHAEGTVALARRFRGVAVAHEVLESVYGYWKRTLDTVRVETPDPAFDVLINGWLVYQVMASRLWGRSGY
jgi:cellobiose phosphorylase